jgi:polar amino acid transport system permease protein
MHPDLSIVLEAWPELWRAIGVTVRLTLACVGLSLGVGILSAACQLSKVTPLYWLSRIYVSIMRGTPLLVQLFVVFFGLPLIGLQGQAFLAAVLAIGLNSGAYVTEILRAAILNVPVGQLEAARVIGMSKVQLWQRILLPQAFVVSLPALTNEFTIVLKSTPLASVVAVTELTYAGQLIIARNYRATAVMLTVALGYILVTLSVSFFSRWLERRFATYRLGG